LRADGVHRPVMLADGDLRHKLRFEDERYAPSTKPSERRVVVATAAAQPAAFEIDGECGHYERLDFVERNHLASRLEDAERPARPRTARAPELQLGASGIHAWKAGAFPKSAGKKLRATFDRQSAIEADGARQQTAREQPLLSRARRLLRPACPPPDFLAQCGLPLLERHSASRSGSASRGFPAMRLAKNEGSGQLKAAAPGKNPPPWPCGQLRWCPALWQVGPWWPASGFPKSADYSRRLAHRERKQDPVGQLSGTRLTTHHEVQAGERSPAEPARNPLGFPSESFSLTKWG